MTVVYEDFLANIAIHRADGGSQGLTVEFFEAQNWVAA
jgi:hypothetical protein